MAQTPNPAYKKRSEPYRANTFELAADAVLNLTTHRRAWRVMATNSDKEGEPPIVSIGTMPRLTTMQLTSLTTEELDALEALWLSAFELARPICEALDEQARNDYEHTESINPRLYRQIPFIAWVPGVVTTHLARLPERFESAAWVARTTERISKWNVVGHLGIPRKGNRAIPDPAPQDVGAGDDGQEAGDVP